MTEKEIRDAMSDGHSRTLLMISDVMEKMAECHVKIAEQKQQKKRFKGD